MRPYGSISIALAIFFGWSMGPHPAKAVEGQNELIERAKNPERAAAARMIEAGQYEQAISLLQNATAKKAGNADIQNSLGFANRKLKRYDAAMRHYKAALQIKPDHRGANEYLDELNLELGRLEEVENRPKVLDAACKFRCEEYLDLEEAIARYKSGNSEYK